MDVVFAANGAASVRFSRPGSIITGAIINGSTTAGHLANALVIENAAHICVVQGNSMRICPTGIDVVATCGASITGNRIEATDNSILLSSGADSNVVIGNSVNRAITDNGASNIVEHNVIYQNKRHNER